MKEFIIFVCSDSTEIFFSKLRSAGMNYYLDIFLLTLTVRRGGVSNKHCLLTFFIASKTKQVSLISYGVTSDNIFS